jgi:hypothetical protein
MALLISTHSQKQFVPNLSGSCEIPPVKTAAFQLSTDEQTLYYQVTVANINIITGVHIHRGKLGQNGTAALFKAS